MQAPKLLEEYNGFKKGGVYVGREAWEKIDLNNVILTKGELESHGNSACGYTEQDFLYRDGDVRVLFKGIPEINALEVRQIYLVCEESA